ncbi:hypothetical protein Tco_1444316 [Tanacetum coccineum]
MNPIATQHDALDNSLVPSEKRLKIEICNARIAFSKPQREETYQVTLEARKLSPCYPAFVITTEVPQIYMHQFWNTITKIRDTNAYSFKLDKNKCRVDTEVFRDILHICPRILNQDFISPPSEEDLVTFIQELGYSGRCASLGKQQDLIDSRSHELKSYGDKTIFMRNKINLYTICDDSLLDIKNSSAYKTYYDFATGKVPPRKARKYKKVASPLRKLSPVKEEKPVKKAKRVKKPAKKSTTAPTAGVVLKDTPGVSVSKKKAPVKGDRSKGNGTDFESEVPDEQQRKTSGTDEGTGTIPGVPDVPIYQYESDDESWGDNEDDNGDEGDNNDDDDDAIKDDDDENPSFNLKDYDEKEHDDEYESNDDNENVFEEKDDDNLYKDVDVRSLGTKHEKERQCDKEMTNANQNVS